MMEATSNLEETIIYQIIGKMELLLYLNNKISVHTQVAQF